MIKDILFLNSFMSCPQKKTPISIRFNLFVIHKLITIDQEHIANVLNERVLLIKPSDLAEFYNQDHENVRSNLAKNYQQLLELSFLKDGVYFSCFEKIDVVRFKGYLIHLNEGFIREVISKQDQKKSINVYKFGKLDSVYSQTLYSHLITSQDDACVLSIDYIKQIFVLDGLYNNHSYNLSKKCVIDPLKKINKIFDTEYCFEKIKIKNDVIWIVAKFDNIQYIKGLL